MTEKMNALRNKKGFTLIEMLVVIAIIAVLVAIVIPVVGNSTNKAACATNAANLRSVKAEITTALLTNDEAKYDLAAIKAAAAGGTTTVQSCVKTPTGGGTAPEVPTAKATTDPEVAADTPMVVEYVNGEVKLSFDGQYIANFADAAAGETTPSSEG